MRAAVIVVAFLLTPKIGFEQNQCRVSSFVRYDLQTKPTAPVGAEMTREKLPLTTPHHRTRGQSNSDRMSIWPDPALLHGERLAGFQALLDGISREIKPRGVIEEMYVHDIAWFVWEIIRLRRCRTATIKGNYWDALLAIFDKSQFAESKGFAMDWLTDKNSKKKIRPMLEEFGFDDSVIEARAIRRSSRYSRERR